MIVPFVGWQGLFLFVGVASAAVLLVLLPSSGVIAATAQPVTGSFHDLLRGYRDLLGTPRGRRTYGYVFLNSMFHSGVFTWLGVYFERRYDIGPVAIGLALLGYGVPGFLLGPLIGRAADRWGRARLLPIGLAVSAIAGAVLMLGIPLILAPLVAMALSRLRHDPTAFRRHRHFARRKACRAGHGPECFHALRWFRPREPSLRRAAAVWF